MCRVWAFVAAVSAIGGAFPAETPGKPNLLIIHCDELNFRTLGCYRALLPKDQAFVWGPDVKVDTPHIDSIAARGAVATRFLATSPVCTPSRASFVSGRYPQNTGSIRNDLPMREDVVTFAEALRRRGYATGYAGKWHLDGPGRPQFAPERRFGFEDNRYMFNRGHWKKLEETEKGPAVAARNAQGRPTYGVEGADEKSFTTDFLTDRAIAFIRSRKGEPFCYMLSFPDPHGPNTVRAPYDTLFSRLRFERPGTAPAAESGAAGKVRAPARGDEEEGGDEGAGMMARYFGMVKCIDDNVGRLLAALEREGILDRTWIVFTADHGDMCGEHGRHNKSVAYEASAGIPFLLAAPGTVRAGTVVREALGTVDFSPTILPLMGAGAPEGMAGRNASHLFRGDPAPAGWRDLTFLRIGDRKNGWMAAVTGRHKLVVHSDGAAELWDREADPWELKNFAGDPACRDTVRELAASLEGYAREQKDPLPADAEPVAAALRKLAAP